MLYRHFGVRDTTGQIDAVVSYPLRIVLVTPDIVRLAAEYARDYRILPYDGIHVAIAARYTGSVIVSADRELDRVGFVRRIDPAEYSNPEGRRA